MALLSDFFDKSILRSNFCCAAFSNLMSVRILCIGGERGFLRLFFT